LSEGGFGPDTEATEVSSGGEGEEVEGADVGGLDSGDVAESLDDTLVLSVDDEGSTTLTVLAVAGLTGTGANLLRGDNLGDIGVSLETLEGGDGFLGLLNRLDRGGDDEGDLGDTFDLVSTGEDERRDGGGGNGGNYGETTLVLVDLDVPLAPDLGRSEHASSSAHVTESGLSRAVGSSSSNTRDTGDGTTGSPGFGRGLVAGVLSNRVRLATVLGDRLVDLSDDVRTDGSGEDGGKGESAGRLAFERTDLDDGSGGHFSVN